MKLSKLQQEFLEKFVAEGKMVGLPRSVSLVMGYLLICEPKQQSAEQLQRQLNLSAGSVSSAISLLLPLGVFERTRHSGERRYYYELRPEGFRRSIEARVASARRYMALADFGLKADADNRRLQTMSQIYRVVADHTERALKDITSRSL